MTALRLYAPVIVLMLFALLRELGSNLGVLALIVLAGAVFIHIRAEQAHTKERR